MSLSDSVEAMKHRFSLMSTEVYRLLTRKPQLVTTSDDADELGGYTLQELQDLVYNSKTVHTEDKNNPHLDNAADLGTHDKEYIDNQFLLHLRTGQLPVSRYGNLGYLPPNVAGSFEGVTNHLPYSATTVQLEDDGTLVWLRNGTEGSTQGVYYSYLVNATTIPVTNSQVHTNYKYRPAFTPSGESVAYVYHSTGGAIAGRFQNASGVATNCFIGLTAGTLAASAHRGCYLASTWDGILKYAEIFVGNDNVYILKTNAYVANSPLSFEMYEITLAEAVSGTTVTPRQITGWNSTTFYGEVMAGSAIQLSSRMVSYNVADKPLYLMDPAVSTYELLVPGYAYWSTLSYQGADGRIRTYCHSNPRFWGTQLEWTTATFSMVINPSTKTAVPDVATYEAPGHVHVDANGKPFYSGTLFRRSTVAAMGHSTHHFMPTLGVTKNGYLFVVSRPLYTFHKGSLAIGKMPVEGDLFAALELANNPATFHHAELSLIKYGSALGSSFTPKTNLPNNRILTFCDGTSVSGETGFNLAVAERGATDNYTYKSILNGSYTGYAPMTFRKTLEDLGKSNIFNAISHGVTCVSADGTVSSAACSVFTKTRLNGYVSIDSNLNLGGSISVTGSQMDSLIDAALGQLGQSTLPFKDAALIIPVGFSANPILVVWGASEFYHDWSVWAVTVSSRSGAIATVSLGGFIDRVYGPHTQTVSNMLSENDRVPWSTVIDLGTKWGYIINPPINIAGYGWAYGKGIRILMDKTTGAIDYKVQFGINLVNNFETFGSFPGKGFGTYYCQDGNGDYSTKLVFAPAGTTAEQFQVWAVPPATSWRVIVSQDVAQGWVVYFTDDTPVLINGKMYRLSARNVDLTTITASPANKTFYVYVKLVAAVINYEISLEIKPESSTRIYVGKIVTDNEQISLIDVNPVTRLANYRITSTPTGIAIPGSPGLPTQPSSLSAGW